MSDLMTLLSGLFGGGSAPVEVAGVAGDPTKPTTEGAAAEAAAPRTLAKLRRPESAAGGPFDAFASSGKMPAASSNKFGALAQGINHGLEGVAAGREKAEASRAAAAKSKLEQVKTLLDIADKQEGRERQGRQDAFEREKFDRTQTGAAEQRKITKDYYDGLIKNGGGSKRGKAANPLAAEKTIQEIVSNHPASKALAAEDESLVKRMTPERRKELEAQVKAEDVRVRGIAAAAGDDEEAPAAPSTTVGAQGAVPPTRPKDTVDPKVRLGQAGAALEGGADPVAVRKMLDDLGVAVPDGFFGPSAPATGTSEE